MEELKAAQPILPPNTETWAAGESAKRILAQIVATDTRSGEQVSRRGTLRAGHLAWGVCGVVLVVLAVFLAVYFLSWSGKEGIITQSTITSSVPGGGNPVTVRQALEQIVALARATPFLKPLQQHPSPGEKLDLVEEARTLRLLNTSESYSIQLEQPTTMKQFSLWLWRCFGPSLHEGSVTGVVSDLDTLTPEEQRAVEGLVRAEVIILPSGGYFEGDRVVTSAEATALLDRVKASLEKPAGQ